MWAKAIVTSYLWILLCYWMANSYAIYFHLFVFFPSTCKTMRLLKFCPALSHWGCLKEYSSFYCCCRHVPLSSLLPIWPLAGLWQALGFILARGILPTYKPADQQLLPFHRFLVSKMPLTFVYMPLFAKLHYVHFSAGRDVVVSHARLAWQID